MHSIRFRRREHDGWWLRLAFVTPITTSLEVGEPFAVTWPASDDTVSVTVLRYGTGGTA